MKKFLPGFTLIELLVSISVVAILTGIGLAGFVQFNRRQVLNSTTRMIVSDLRLAQSKAKSGEKPADCKGGLLGYKFVMNDLISYELQADCSPRPVVVKKVNFPPNVKKIAGFNTVKFKSKREGVELDPQDKDFIQIQAFDSSDFQKTIKVGKAGEIYVQ